MGKRCGAMEIMVIKAAAGKLASQFEKYTPGVAVKNIIYHFATRERRRSFGNENKDKTVYIIRSIADKSPFYIGPVHNLLANYFYVLSHIGYAYEKGWIPVVDELNYPVYNSESNPINGTLNAWEYFWKQPGGISFDEAYKSKNAVMSKQSWIVERDMGYDAKRYTDRETVSQYAALAAAAPLNEITANYVETVRRSLIPESKKVLGVNTRAGGYDRHAVIHGQGHPIQPEIDELIETVKMRMDSWGMDNVFLASDTEFAVEAFAYAFGDRLLLYPRQRAVIGTEYARDAEKILYAPGRSYQTSLDYLTEMELLAGCNCLIGSVTSGFRYAVVRNAGAFEHLEVLDCGRFDDNRKRGK